MPRIRAFPAVFAMIVPPGSISCARSVAAYAYLTSLHSVPIKICRSINDILVPLKGTILVNYSLWVNLITSAMDIYSVGVEGIGVSGCFGKSKAGARGGFIRMSSSSQ